MKQKIIIVAIISLLISACSFEIKKSQSELLFDSIQSNYTQPSDSISDTLTSILRDFDITELDSAHKKAFWFNAYNILLEDLSHHPTGYMDFNRFLKKEFIVANKQMTTKDLITKIESFNDPRALICLDFYTTTSSKTFHNVLTKDTEEALDSLCSHIINDPHFIRIKSEAKTVYYPEHFDWHLKDLHASTTSKDIIMKYHFNKELEELEFLPYPFSYKLRD